MRVFDSHAHLTDKRFKKDLDLVVQSFKAAGGEYLMEVSEHLENAEACIANAARFDFIYAAVGIHPLNVERGLNRQRLVELCSRPKVFAIGEIGLDYHYEGYDKALQQRIFTEQMDIAAELGLPVIIHSRDAAQDTLSILSAYSGRVEGVMHCFSGSAETAARVLDMGFYVSFAGPLTYPKANRLKEAARLVPEDRVLIETDCPYLAPQPVRGQRNQPAFVVHTLNELASIKEKTPEIMADITTQNAKRLFRIS